MISRFKNQTLKSSHGFCYHVDQLVIPLFHHFEIVNKKIKKITLKLIKNRISYFPFSIFLSSWNKKVKLEKYKNANFRKIILWLQPCWVWQTLIHQSRSLRFLSSFMKYKKNRGKLDLPKRLKSKSGFVVHFTIENTPKYPKIKIIYYF